VTECLVIDFTIRTVPQLDGANAFSDFVPGWPEVFGPIRKTFGQNKTNDLAGSARLINGSAWALQMHYSNNINNRMFKGETRQNFPLDSDRGKGLLSSSSTGCSLRAHYTIDCLMRLVAGSESGKGFKRSTKSRLTLRGQAPRGELQTGTISGRRE
jgi:hypothetical protein